MSSVRTAVNFREIMDQRAKKKAPMPPKQQDPRARSHTQLIPNRPPAAGRPPEGKAPPSVSSGPSFGAWLTAIGTAGLQNSRNANDYKRFVNEFYLSKVRDALSKVSQQVQSDIQDRTMARLVMKSLVDTIAGGVGPIAQGTVLDPVRKDRAASVNDDVRTFAKLATTSRRIGQLTPSTLRAKTRQQENDMNLQDTIKALRAAGYHKEAREVAALMKKSNMKSAALKKAEHLEFQSPEDAQRSLDQFAENTSELYEAKLAVLRGLLKFMKANKYSSELAKRSWTRFLKQAAQRYAAEEGEPGDEKLFRAALPALVDEWEAHYAKQLKSGEHDYLLEKKAMKKKASTFEVIVSNVGTVLTTEDEAEARAAYDTYVEKSESHWGRAADESVVLMKDGEPVDEYTGLLESGDHEASVKKASPEGWPNVDDIAQELHQMSGDLSAEDLADPEGVDVRLQVREDGSWDVHLGLSDYDTDHHGFWGSSTLSTESDFKAVAADLLDQAEEDHAMAVDEGATSAATKRAKLSPQQLGIIEGLLKDMDPQDPAYKALSEYAKGLKTQGPSKGTAVGIQSLARARKARIAARKQAGPRDPRKPKGDFALVKKSGMDDIVVSVHKTKAEAEAAMRKKGGEPDSMFTNGLHIVDVGPTGRAELINVFGKWTTRPKTAAVKKADGLGVSEGTIQTHMEMLEQAFSKGDFQGMARRLNEMKRDVDLAAKKAPKSAATKKLAGRKVKIPEAEVQYEITAEDEDTAPDFQSGDPGYKAEDDAMEEDAKRRMKSGDIYGWFVAKCTAKWKKWTGVAYIGGNSYASEADFLKDVNGGEFADLKADALDDLKAKVQDHADETDAIEREEEAPKKANVRRAAFDPRSAVVYFDLHCEDYQIEADAEDPESMYHDLAKKILADKEGRVLLDMEFNALKQLTKILGTRIGNEGHDNDDLVCKITSVNTVDDVEKLFDKLHVTGGDDVIDTGVPYFVAQGFTLFPEGVNGPQVKYTDFDDWKAEEATAEAPKKASTRRVANQSLLDTPEDMQWLREVHLPDLSTDFQSAMLFGNEDSPNKIEVYKDQSPNHDDVPVTYVLKRDEEAGVDIYVKASVRRSFIDDEELAKKETSEYFDAEMEGLDEDDPEFKALQDRRNALGAALKRRARLAAQKKTGNRLTTVKKLAPLLKDLLDGGSTQEQPKNIQPQLKKLEAAGLIRHGKDQEGHLGWSLTADGREWLA